MSIKKTLSDWWTKATSAIAAPQNTMSNEAVAYIAGVVSKKTGLQVYGQDYTAPYGMAIAGVKKNVGLIVPENMTKGDLQYARQVFIDAAAKAGVTLTKADVCLYEQVKQSHTPKPSV